MLLERALAKSSVSSLGLVDLEKVHRCYFLSFINNLQAATVYGKMAAVSAG
jgi:hypothetical protein